MTWAAFLVVVLAVILAFLVVVAHREMLSLARASELARRRQQAEWLDLSARVQRSEALAVGQALRYEADAQRFAKNIEAIENVVDTLRDRLKPQAARRVDLSAPPTRSRTH